MKLLAFAMRTGCHLGGWRHPDAWTRALTDIDYFRTLAQAAERGKVDAIVFADTQGFRRVAGEQAFARGDFGKPDEIW